MSTTYSLYDVSVPAFIKALQVLGLQLEKAHAHSEAVKVRDVNAMLTDRLTFDMLPLIKQVQLVSDIAKRTAGMIAGVEIPKMEDTETTFAEAQERIAKTVSFLQTITAEQMDGNDATVIPFAWMPTKGVAARDCITAYALPNFYFHAATAYSIMRKNGFYWQPPYGRCCGKINFYRQHSYQNTF
jgi:uncharacterized protein